MNQSIVEDLKVHNISGLVIRGSSGGYMVIRGSASYRCIHNPYQYIEGIGTLRMVGRGWIRIST